MTFTARYVHRTGVYKDYFRTIYADGVNEAIKLADRRVRNGYQCIGLIQKECIYG